jgi:hypothetical protein
MITNPVEELHHPSHTHLLSPVNDRPPAVPVDAIIVPSFRPADQLDHLFVLAAALECRLLVLCSGQSRATDVIARAPYDGAEVIAIDVAGLDHLLPSFRTTRLIDGTHLHRPTDTSFKRNLGLLVARTAGWRRVVFMDDDIVVPEPDDLSRAAGLLDRFDVVGMHNTGYPDNSVVCHALRAVGGRQGTFIGGGGMVVRPHSTFSFFPKIYNEDWFYLLHRARMGTVGRYGSMHQKSYDPFASPARATSEEFGDCLAEGLFWVLDNGGRIGQADHAHWRMFLGRRRKLIDRVTAMVINRPVEHKGQMLASLGAARRQLALITPELCMDFIHAWQQDRRLWTAFAGRLPSRPTDLAVALAEIGVPGGHYAGVDVDVDAAGSRNRTLVAV